MTTTDVGAIAVRRWEQVMTSMKDIVADATSAATKGWNRARLAAFGGRAGDTGAPEASNLARLIESDIIPRLLAGRGNDAAPAAPQLPAGLVQRLARALLDDDAAVLVEEIEALDARGHDPQFLMEQLIAPAARLLGDWWLGDDIDFVDVTMGLWRCQMLVHALSARHPGGAAPTAMQRHALILPAPGEQHVLGSMIVEDAFRRAGWATQSGAALDEDALVALVAREAFDMVGLSAGSQRVLAGLPRTIAAMRRAAGRPLLVLVGGPVINGEAAIARRIGADGAARDAAHAVALAELHLAGQPPVRAAEVAGAAEA
jgi:methanogenic corrinoid protein MtbC1